MAVVPFDPSIARLRRPMRPIRPSPAARAPIRPRVAEKPAPPPAPPQPRLRVNLSPAAATRTLASLGLGIALCAAVATTLSLTGGGAMGLGHSGPTAVGRFAAWLVSLPWLFLGLTLFAVSRIERFTKPEAGRAWSLLAAMSALVAALQVGRPDALRVVDPVVGTALVLAFGAAVAVACRRLFTGDSPALRVQIVAAVTTGLVVTTGPFMMIGELLLPAADRTGALAAVLAGSDALLGLVVATLAVHAGLAYVRDYLPDFSIALDTADEDPAPMPRVPQAPRRS